MDENEKQTEADDYYYEDFSDDYARDQYFQKLGEEKHEEELREKITKELLEELKQNDTTQIKLSQEDIESTVKVEKQLEKDARRLLHAETLGDTIALLREIIGYWQACNDVFPEYTELMLQEMRKHLIGIRLSSGIDLPPVPLDLLGIEDWLLDAERAYETKTGQPLFTLAQKYKILQNNAIKLREKFPDLPEVPLMTSRDSPTDNERDNLNMWLTLAGAKEKLAWTIAKKIETRASDALKVMDKESRGKDYAKAEADIAKRFEIAYQSFKYAEEQTGKSLTYKEAYEYLKENGVKGIPDFELGKFDTWQRYARDGRRHHGDSKNTRRGGRMSRSAVDMSNDPETVNRITNQFKKSTELD